MKRTIMTLAIAALFTAATASAQYTAGSPRSGGWGPGDGTGNQGQGPRDGSGWGSQSGKGKRNGTCDQTGPKGNRGGGSQSRGGGKR